MTAQHHRPVNPPENTRESTRIYENPQTSMHKDLLIKNKLIEMIGQNYFDFLTLIFIFFSLSIPSTLTRTLR